MKKPSALFPVNMEINFSVGERRRLKPFLLWFFEEIDYFSIEKYATDTGLNAHNVDKRFNDLTDQLAQN